MNSILLMILLGVNWHQEMKTLFQYYTFDIKISNNIFFGPILMWSHLLILTYSAIYYYIISFYIIGTTKIVPRWCD